MRVLVDDGRWWRGGVNEPVRPLHAADAVGVAVRLLQQMPLSWCSPRLPYDPADYIRDYDEFMRLKQPSAECPGGTSAAQYRPKILSRDVEAGESNSTKSPRPEPTPFEGVRRVGRELASLCKSACWVAEHPAWAIIIAMGMALVARGRVVPRLGSKSLWLDEAFALALARHGWAGRLVDQLGPPGRREHAPLPAAPAPLARVGVVWRRRSAVCPSHSQWRPACPPSPLAKRLFSSGAAAASIFVPVLALNAFFVQYAQEARAYSLGVLYDGRGLVDASAACHRPADARRWLAYVFSPRCLRSTATTSLRWSSSRTSSAFCFGVLACHCGCCSPCMG